MLRNAIGQIAIDASEFWKHVGRLFDKAENLASRGTLPQVPWVLREVGRQVGTLGTKGGR